MRDYGTVENLGKAATLSAVITLMALGRMAQADMPLAPYLPLTFVAMTLVCGSVTGWGDKAGMPGVFASRGLLVQGTVVAMVLALVALALHRFGTDEVVRGLLIEPRHEEFLELTLPSTLSGQLSLLLWSGGVQVIFLAAAPMSLFARLTRNRWVALVLCLFLRAYVVHQQMAFAGVEQGASFFLSSALLFTAASCILFAVYGLVPAMVFAAAAELHVFFGP